MATANFFCLTVARVEGLKGEDPSLVLFGVGIYVLLLALAFFSRHLRRRAADNFPIADLIHRPRADRGDRGRSTGSFWTSTRPCSDDLRVRSRPILAKIPLQAAVAGGTWSHRICIMSDTMPRRRKINTRAGRLAARERVRQLVSAHLAPAVGRKGQMQGTCAAECPQEIATAYLRRLSRLSFGFLGGVLRTALAMFSGVSGRVGGIS